ncbi:MAG: MBL fold metallo-hydrolase [Candidatus Dojkabacteria bacterium]
MTKYILLTILVISNFFVWTNLSATEARKGALEIDILNIGQGDSILIKTPNNHFGLIDGGRDSTVLGELSQVLPIGKTYLDFVIMTHPDADHIAGFIDVFKNYQVNKVFFNKADKSNEVITKIKDEIQEFNIKNYSIDMENDFTIDGIYFDFTWPQDHTKTYTFSNSNDMSASVLIKYEGYKFLTMGDLPSDYEEPSLKNLPVEDRDIDFLKVSHHGSKYSTNLEFLQEIKPEYSFISVGKDNTYGHPTEEVIDNLEKVNSKIFRTDKDGRITLNIRDGKAEITTLESMKDVKIN